LFARSASCDVTPRDRPVRLAGYAVRTTPISTILDPIEISAVLLEGAGARALIFSFDLMIVGSELQTTIVGRLAKHGFQPNEIILLASHTHFAPATDTACARLGVPETQFVNDVAVAAEGLLLRMMREPASEITLEILQGRLDHSISRRRAWPYPTLGRTGLRLRSIAMAPEPQGATDELATVLLLRRTNDAEVMGIIWHYTCHPTAVVPLDAISADFPGTVRRALRTRFGEVACVFAQGFCGDISPKLRPSTRKPGLGTRLRRMVSGPTFPAAAAEEWTRWSENLAARVVEIASGPSEKKTSPANLAIGSASIPLGDFFAGSAPDKPLTAQALRLGDAVELIALSAEATVEWQDIIDRAIPVRHGRIRLYAGYLGALFGYLPTPVQIEQGGYEVEGFQPLFGLSGKFDAEKITPAVIDCVKQAVADLEAAGNQG
jgi:hypothetical protein